MHNYTCDAISLYLMFPTIIIIQLSVYMDEQRINPWIPYSYSAIAVNNETLDQVMNNLTEKTLIVSRKDVLITCPIIATALTMFVTITVLILYCCGRSTRNKQSIGLSDQSKAIIITVSFISIGRILTFIGFDIVAIYAREEHLDLQVRSIYHSGKTGQLNDIMYNIPVTLMVFDCLAFLVCAIMIMLGTCFHCKCVSQHCHFIKDSYYYFLALTVIPLIFSAYSHAPYIIMAYISDADYASSIFIYYVIVMFVEFGVLEYMFNTLFKKSRKNNIIFCGLLLLATLLSVVINAIMATIFVFFFFVPIKYALSSAPNEVLVIYQSAIILVGGYITYKAVFKDKPSQFKFNCDQMNNDIAVLEDELAHFKHTESAVEANPGIIKEKRGKITTLRKEVALASLKQKIALLQNEKDNERNSTKITHLRNEICRLNNEIIIYFQEREKSLSGDDKEDEKAYLKDKIYSADLEVIEQLEGKIFDAWSNPYKDSYIVNVRVEMSISLQRVFGRFIDHPDSVKRLKEDIDDMDKRIKAKIKGLNYYEQKLKSTKSKEDDVYKEVAKTSLCSDLLYSIYLY